MRKKTLVTVVSCLAVLAALQLASCTSSQQQQPQQNQSSEKASWLVCPNCLNDEETAAEREKTKSLPFDPHDLTGVWGQNRVQLSIPAPSLTPEGQKLYDATKADAAADGSDEVTNNKDGMLICDPLGWPRWFTYNYGFEFAQMPKRVVQFIEWGHTWRDVWTDGRPLPENVEPRWLGYSVGRWEGNTFVIESSGFDERSWLSENRQARRWGYPHSDQLRTEERYQRLDHNTLEATLTINDPKVYTQPWVTKDKFFLSPNTEIGEYFCVPSEFNQFNAELLAPSENVKPTAFGPGK